MAGNIDPIGRLSVLMQAGIGPRGTWRGASAAAALRRTMVGLDASTWYVEHEASITRDHLAPSSSDIRYAGGGLQARLNAEGSSSAYLVRATASAGRVSNAVLEKAGRLSAAAEARGRLSWSIGRINMNAAAGLFAEMGKTGGEGWQRTIGSAALTVGTTRYHVRADWLRGSVTAPTATGFGSVLEQFVVGGAGVPIIDPGFLAQRIALPAVPAGFVSGRTVQLLRGTLGGNAWEPYFVGAAAGESLDDVKRIAGVERTFAITSLGFARLPGIRARAGAAYSFDEPFASRARAYASLTFTP
jgi:hypothetical protein